MQDLHIDICGDVWYDDISVVNVPRTFHLYARDLLVCGVRQPSMCGRVHPGNVRSKYTSRPLPVAADANDLSDAREEGLAQTKHTRIDIHTWIVVDIREVDTTRHMCTH